MLISLRFYTSLDIPLYVSLYVPLSPSCFLALSLAFSRICLYNFRVFCIVSLRWYSACCQRACLFDQNAFTRSAALLPVSVPVSRCSPVSYACLIVIILGPLCMHHLCACARVCLYLCVYLCEQTCVHACMCRSVYLHTCAGMCVTIGGCDYHFHVIVASTISAAFDAMLFRGLSVPSHMTRKTVCTEPSETCKVQHLVTTGF